ncbi:hypothetical protein [Streptosporangium carneum]|uniref:Uncharacterized protein n=1 Tax=Streptosporangium carneum TaxID=47481 RepID=A0A9W6HUT7_9ACTN|nr:hypothetical protein [Streptosporangium carneum]GLK06737.1 hypothetical protein GCM10017600_01420 [Streptosporangium carneum]
MASHIDGLPVYRYDEVPDGLATRTQLVRDHRRRPAEGQAPRGWLFYHGNKHAPLYEIETARPMRPLSEAQVAAARARRTHAYVCGVCLTESTRPLELSVDRALACGECVMAMMDIRNHDARHRAWQRDRAAAAAWAREVLADPAAAVVAVTEIPVRPAEGVWERTAPSRVVVLSVDGQVLVDVALTPSAPPRRKRDVAADAVPLDQVAERLVEVFGGRRLVAWRGSEMYGLTRGLAGWWHAAHGAVRALPEWRVRHGHELAERVLHWSGHHGGPPEHRPATPEPPVGDALERAHQMLRLLRRVAAIGPVAESEAVR